MNTKATTGQFGLFLSVLTVLLSFFPGYGALAGVVEGTIRDFDTGRPIPFASVRLEGTGRSMIANENGEYRIRLVPGTWRFKFSHIGYYSEHLKTAVTDSGQVIDVHLHPAMIILKGQKVYSRAYDPAQRIIIEAIERKDEILSRTHDYSFDAYTRLVARDTARQDTAGILLITESQIEGFWEHPDKFKEIIKARKQTANLAATGNLVSVGRILDFNRNRLDFGPYSVVSPTAKDALDYYNYYLLDTLYIDRQMIFRLEIEPQSDAIPLFAGTIDIADSSYAVVGVDVGFNEGFDQDLVDSLRYLQRYEEFDHDRWMPIEIRFSGIFNISLPVIPVISFNYVAALHNYRFDAGHPEARFDEYVLEVAPEADEVDSVAWTLGQVIPLSKDESGAYKRFDSLASAPVPLHKRILGLGFGALYLITSTNDYFHFNRVEGAYLGLAFNRREILPRLDLGLRSGYAIDGEYWQHDYGFAYTLRQRPRLRFNFRYRNIVAHRPTVISSTHYDPTFLALMAKIDQYDYFREKGFTTGMDIRLLRHTELSVAYHDYRQYSADNSTNFSIFRTNADHRPNPEIADGRLRSIAGEFRWDSRRLMKSKNEEIPMLTMPHTVIKTGMEYASPDFIRNDFDFHRYHVSIHHERRFLGLGFSSIYFYAGASKGNLPPQRYFTVDYTGEFMPEKLSFKSLGEHNYCGDWVCAVYFDHDFRRTLFRRSGLPLIRDFPFSLAVHGGAFWTDFRNRTDTPRDESVRSASVAYSEIGFSIGRITPLGFGLHFTWQLSAYDTEKFSFDITILDF